MAVTPAPGGAAQSAPVLSLAPHHNAYRDAAQGSATLSYSTPAYVSMNQPRSVSLLFSSALLRPMSLVQVNATDNSTVAPVRMSLRLKNEFGAWMTLSNGTQEIFYQSGAGATRLAAQFEEPRSEPLSYSYTAVVRSWWADGTSLESTIPVRAAKVSSGTSEFGRGWTLGGFQQLYNQGGAVHVVENGTGTFFWEVCDGSGCRYPGPGGDFTTITWDGTGWRRAYPDGTVVRFAAYHWNNRGRMDWVEDRFGNRMTYGYDASNRLTSITDPVGKVTTLGYNAEGILGWIEDPMGRRVNTTTSSVYLFRLWDPDGSLALDLGFVGAGVLQTSWNKGADRNVAGTGWDYAYDPFGQLASVTAPQVSTTDAGLTRPVTSMKSLEAAVLPTPGTGTTLTNAAPRVLPQNVRVETTDPRGNTTKVAVNNLNLRNPIRVEAPLGRVATASYNAHGQVTRTITPSGDTISMKYAGEKLVRSRDHSSGRVLDYEYFGNLPKRVVSRADTMVAPMLAVGDTVVAEYEYGVDHEVDWKLGKLQFAQAGPEAHYYSYDAVYKHLVDHEWGPGGERQYWYNAMANVDSVRDASGGTTSFTRDVYGRITATRFRKDSVARNDSVVYDVLNRIHTRTSPDGNVVSYIYSGDQLTRVDDPRGLAYGFEYNALGLLTKRTYPDGGSDIIEYDRAGNVTRETDRRNRTVTLTYDALGQLASRAADGQTTRFRTDPLGRFQVVANSESTDSIHFQRAGLGREVTAFTTRGARSHSFVTSYDRNGLRKGIVSSSLSSGYQAGFEHEGADHGYAPNAIVASGLRTANVAPPYARFRQHVLPTGDSIRFDNFSIQYSRPSLQATFGEALQRDATGRLAYRRVQDRRVDHPDTVRIRLYSYDAAGMLRQTADSTAYYWEECRDDDYDGYEDCTTYDSRGSTGSRSYTYDESGNPTHSGATLGVGNRLSSFNGYTLGYDAAGNLVSKSKAGFSQTLDWNSLGQVTRVVTNGVEVTFGYDGFGRRVRKTVSGGQDARYLYDGNDLVAELDAAGNLVAKYFFTPGIDNPHSMERGGTRYFYLRDSQGSVVGLIDSAGNLTHRYKYDSFGSTEFAVETVPQPFRYTAREYDIETGLYFYRARYYDPQLQRFVSQDPIGLAGGINPYTYAGNDPVNNNDPSGLAWQCWTVHGAGNYKVGATIGGKTQVLGSGPGQYCFDDSPVARTNRELQWRFSMLGGNMADYGYGDLGDEAAYIEELEVAARLNEVEEKKATAATSTLYDRCVVAQQLNALVTTLRSEPWNFYPDYHRDFDYKAMDEAANGGQQLNYYQIGDQWLRSDQFGNFAAGYAGTRAFGAVGYWAMRIGGVDYANRKDSTEDPWDRDSAPMIRAGREAARRDARRVYTALFGNIPSGSPPLTSRAGCTSN